MRFVLLTVIALSAMVFPTQLVMALAINQVDDFEDGTTQGWIVNLLGLGAHPSPPQNIPDGGPSGIGDNYLQIESVGGNAEGSRLSVINLGQWAGDYTSTGITGITADLNNFGATDLNIRLLFEDPTIGPPTNVAVSTDVFLPAGGGWTPVTFGVTAADLTTLQGDVNALLSGVTALRFIHNPDAGFPPPPIVALLGIDNIQAIGPAVIPEPSTAVFFAVGILGILGLGLKRRRKAT